MGAWGNLAWTERLFVVLFLVFAVGGSWVLRPSSLEGALGTLVGGTVLAIAVWLGVVWLTHRRKS